MLTAVDKAGAGMRGGYLGSVNKLLGFIVIDSIDFHKWVRLAEEVLQKQRKQS